MQCIVIHPGYGGFGLTHEGVSMYARYRDIELYPYVQDIPGSPFRAYDPAQDRDKLIYYSTRELAEGDDISDSYFAVRSIERDDPALVKAVQLTEQPELKIVEIPDDVEWVVEEYDGAEWIAEKHRTWC